MEPLVSILIPAYNAQPWIAETLRSAVGQTWVRKEIIVVDDGSEDDTPSIARRFEPLGIQVVSQTNQGAAAARNVAFSLSRGNYIQWLDADDLLAPDKIACQLAALDHSQGARTLLSSAWGRFIDAPDRTEFVATSLWCDLTPSEWLLRQMEDNLYMQTASWLVSRELTEAAGPWDTRLLGDDDGEYFARVLLASEKTRFVPDAKVYYRVSGSNSLSHIGTCDRKREAQWLSMKLHIQYLRSLDDSERARAACVKYLQDWMVFFCRERPDIFQQAAEIARELGGMLQVPSSPRKHISRGLRRYGRHVKPDSSKAAWSLHPSWNGILSNIGRRKRRGVPADDALPFAARVDRLDNRARADQADGPSQEGTDSGAPDGQ